MKRAVVSLILALCIAIPACVYRANAATKQPAWRLYMPCPITRVNVPMLKPEQRS